MEIKEIREELRLLGDKNRAEHSKKYLKSDYSFYGVTVPKLRAIAKEFKQKNPDTKIYDVYNVFDELWNSGNHEEMSLAMYLIGLYKKQFNLETWDFLMKRVEKAKSWDHIDELSSHIIGEIFLANPNLQSQIKELSISRNPWMRRLSIVSQYPLIRKGKIQLTFLLAEKLVYDDNIYVQKGAGWMIREAGKKNPVQAQEFIKINRNMKPAAFSYSTEKMLDLRKRLKEQIKQEKLEKEEKQKKGEQSVNEVSSLELNKIKYFKN
jgi:3-methyladenine DNA glycosylase AlkD